MKHAATSAVEYDERVCRMIIRCIGGDEECPLDPQPLPPLLLLADDESIDGDVGAVEDDL